MRKRTHTFTILLICLLSFSHTIVHAQIEYFGIINDPDGYTNVHHPENSQIIDKINKNQVFFDWDVRSEVEKDMNNPWHTIEYGNENGVTNIYKGIESKQGKIHKTRIRYLSELPKLSQ